MEFDNSVRLRVVCGGGENLSSALAVLLRELRVASPCRSLVRKSQSKFVWFTNPRASSRIDTLVDESMTVKAKAMGRRQSFGRLPGTPGWGDASLCSFCLQIFRIFRFLLEQ